MDMIKTAVRSLWRKRFRTLLTMGGIVIGVSLVAVVSVIGAVGKGTVSGELESMGLGGLSVTSSGEAALEESSLRALRALREVESAVPLMLETSSLTHRGGGTAPLMLCGIDSGEVQAIGLELLHGRLLSESDISGSARVCVVDTAVAQNAYERENIVGRELTVPVGGVEECFTVVGVTRADSALFQNVAQFIPGMVYVPYTSMQQLTGRTDFDQFAVRLREGTDDGAQAKRIEATLRQVGGTSGYRAEDLSAQKERLSGLMDIVTMVLTAISAISLLVSGLSIMTVMMVSVGERTREIGIKKALGATRADIMREFLTESLLLSVIGGLIGVALGAAAGAVGTAIFGLSLPSLTSLGWLVAFAAVIGIVFGVYPAAKAAKLDPVDALRWE